MRRDVQFEHIQQQHEARLRALEHFEVSESSHRRQEFHSIMTDISPVRFDEKLNYVESRVCEGTGKWLLRDPGFSNWLSGHENHPRLLWLQGIPGAGTLMTSDTLLTITNSKRLQERHFCLVLL